MPQSARIGEVRLDMDPDMLALHQAIAERNAKILYRGTGVEGYNDSRAVCLR